MILQYQAAVCFFFACIDWGDTLYSTSFKLLVELLFNLFPIFHFWNPSNRVKTSIEKCQRQSITQTETRCTTVHFWNCFCGRNMRYTFITLLNNPCHRWIASWNFVMVSPENPFNFSFFFHFRHKTHSLLLISVIAFVVHKVRTSHSVNQYFFVVHFVYCFTFTCVIYLNMINIQ